MSYFQCHTVWPKHLLISRVFEVNGINRSRELKLTKFEIHFFTSDSEFGGGRIVFRVCGLYFSQVYGFHTQSSRVSRAPSDCQSESRISSPSGLNTEVGEVM